MPISAVSARTLETAKRSAGSWAALARALGVGSSTILGWRRRGVPDTRAQALADYVSVERGKRRPRKPAKKVRAPRELVRGLELAGAATELAVQLAVTPKEVLRWKATGKVPDSIAPALHEYVAAASRARESIGSPKRELEKAIRIAGGIEALKLRFGIKQDRTIKRWLTKGPSRKGWTLLIEYHQTRQAERQVKLAGDERLDALMGLMNAEDEKLLVVQSSSVRREGERTEGWRWTKRWRRPLTQAFIDDVVSWTVSHKRQHPSWNVWHGAMLSIQFDPEGQTGPVGMGKKTDYVILGVRQIEGVIADKARQTQEKVRDFLIPLRHGTYRGNSALDIAEHFRALLTTVLESGNFTHVISTTLYNYRVRSQDERRARAAERTREWRARRRGARGQEPGAGASGTVGRGDTSGARKRRRGQ